ncbi:M13 family metallopeptidase [Olivibacter domesticus]|uniref:Putative endopeptidase n=1 Tax=Olivibacter domesticus TaxID=407022 RepID=A0A1H7MZD5_OLID1|nr:M13 family metallopeptidase [Olivibacter domesticus]SEL16128.1 putative endopeptidase [Olivibacter domesticus]
MKYYFPLLYCGIAVMTFQGCTQSEKGTTLSNTPEKLIDPANMDTTVKPGDDFFHYASGVWLKNNPVPAKETRWGSFNQLRDFNAKAVKSILEEVVNNKEAKAGSPEQRVGDFFASAMDSTQIDARGDEPIKADLARINDISTIKDIVGEIGFQHTVGIGSPLYRFNIDQDEKNTAANIAQFGQGGLTLPDRDYYLVNNTRNRDIKQAYETYVQKLFTLAGSDDALAVKKFEQIWEIESALAKAQWSREEMRDPYKTYNKLTLAALEKSAPQLNWQETYNILKIKGADSVIINNPDFFKNTASLLTDEKIDQWKTYLQWNVLKNAAPILSTPFIEASFAFTQALTGQKEITPRWQRSFNVIDENIGDLLGQLYVAKYFKPEAKKRMVELVKNLSETYEERIKTLDWMSETTKKKAIEKLRAFTPKIGYPDKWKTYNDLEIKRDDYFGNIRRAKTWDYNDMVAQLGKPVDKTRWGMTPPTVNAYYNPVNNEIAFPAGILQFPFFDFAADDAVNYGGIGAVIGHEMTHGFDDQGRQYAADGNLKDWWTKEDADNFKKLADKVVNQYSGYTVLDTLHVKGKLTLGENLADLGGLAMAYAAFKKTPQGQSDEKIDGLTPDQRFFLSWAQVWRMNTTPETAAQLITVDPHSPADARTVGPIVNMDAWYKAFDVKEGNKLYKAENERVRVW